MRLLFVSNLFPDTDQPWRGLDNVTLLHAMRELRPAADIRVLCLRASHAYWKGAPCLLSPRPGDDVFQPKYAWVPYLPKFGGWNDRLFELGLRRALPMLPDGWQPDALLTPWLFPDACGVGRSAALAKVGQVAVAQGSDLHHYLAMPMRRRAILKLAKRAGTIITRSADLRRRLIAAGAREARVETIYNGVDTALFKAGDKEQARRELGLPVAGHVLLFVGNFLPVKGLDLLIRAAAIVKQQSAEPLHLVLIGSGPLEVELRALIEQSGLGAAAVTFPGRKPPASVAHFMRAADAVCLSSHNEGVPNVLLESLASGRPLVSTDVGGISEIIERSPNGGGRLVQGRDPRHYAEVLLQALRASPATEPLTEYAAQFSWDRCARAYWERLDRARESVVTLKT